MSFWTAGAFLVGTVGSAVISSKAASKAASSQRKGLDAATIAQLEALDKQIAAEDRATQAMLQGYGMAADATRYGADQSREALKYGADTAAESAQKAIDAQMAMYNQTREDQMPWLQAGKRALATLEKMTYAGPGEFKESPGYQFRLDQGNKNVLGAASATGALDSGRTRKALMEYGQNYASNEYGNFLNQYYQSLTPFQAIAGAGLTSAQTIGQAGTQAGMGMAGTYNALARNQLSNAGQLAGTYTNEGNALAQNYMGAAGATASGYQNQGNLAVAGGNLQSNNIMGNANISAQNTLNNAGIWTNMINQGLSAYGMYKGFGGGNLGTVGNLIPSQTTWQNSPASYSNPNALMT